MSEALFSSAELGFMQPGPCVSLSQSTDGESNRLYKYLTQMSFWFCYGFGTRVQNIITGRSRGWSRKVFTALFPSPLAPGGSAGNGEQRTPPVASAYTSPAPTWSDRHRTGWGVVQIVTYKEWKSKCFRVRLLISYWLLCPLALQLVFIRFSGKKDQVFSCVLRKNGSRDETTVLWFTHNNTAFSFPVHRALKALTLLQI